MKKKFFALIFAIFIALPFAMLFSGCEEENFIGISAQTSRQKIDYGQEFDPIASFRVRSHYMDGKVEELGEDDLTYTVIKDDEIYELDELFEGGFYTFEFTYNDYTCKAYLTVNKIDYTQTDIVEIDNFAVNRQVSMPTLQTISDGNVNFFYNYANAHTSASEKLWLYEEGDTNETIAPGDYVIYAKVDEGTNYHAYTTASAPFHVSPEPLDESYSITNQTLTATYNFGTTLEDYSQILGETIKLQRFNEETGITEDIEGSFEWSKPADEISVELSGNKHYIHFVSDDETLNGKEFEITFNLQPLTIQRPILTLNPDKTTIQDSVIYNGDEQTVYFETDYTVEHVENTVRIYKDEKIIIACAGTFSATNAGTYSFVETLVDKNTCWDNNTTEELSYTWSITQVPFDYEIYAKINKNAIMLESHPGTITETIIARDKLDDISYVKLNTLGYVNSISFGFMGLAYKDAQTGEFHDLPDYFTTICNDETNKNTDDDLILRTLYLVENTSNFNRETDFVRDPETNEIINEKVGVFMIPNYYDNDDVLVFPMTISFAVEIYGDGNHADPTTPLLFSVILTR